MSKRILLVSLLYLLLQLNRQQSHAQCLPGYTQAEINWDNLDYLVTTGFYSGYVTASMANNQYFALGPNRMRMSLSASIGAGGENGTHTGNIANYTGDDVQFTPTADNHTVTMVTTSEILNSSFTLYDVDGSSRIDVDAWNALDVKQSVTITLQGSTILARTNGINAFFTSNATTLANTDNRGTATINIPTGVDSIIITVTTRGTDPVIWLSDFRACVTGSYPNNYYNINRPFTGMPSYVLGIINNEVYMVNPANGRAKFLFSDTNHTNINSTAYDPVNRIFYYAYSIGTASVSTNKTLRKWNYDTETFGVVTTDLSALLNIPTFEVGVASAANNFYDGKLYFGVEAHKLSNPSRLNGLRENIVWRIDLDGSQNPITASQVFARISDGGGSVRHDWADVCINNGIMYDFNSATVDSGYTHYDLMTGQHVEFIPPATDVPRQATIDWTGQVYTIGGAPASVGYIAPYNYDGTLNNALRDTITIPPSLIPPTGSWGDGGEAFRPLCDFGDAPASYDPDPLSPAVNERDTLLRIGLTFDREWTKTSSALANGDGSDEDGISTVPIFNNNHSIYGTQVNVFNNTGANATVIGWFDWNANGVFDVAEASTVITVPTSAVMQNIVLNWTGISSPIATGGSTFMRIRISSTSNGMTTSNPTGWFDNGETEDYRVLVSNIILPVNLVSFDAKAINNAKVKLNWSASEGDDFNGYQVQRSRNGRDWEDLKFVRATGPGGIRKYEHYDNSPYSGESFYRLKLVETSNEKFSEVKKIRIANLESMVSVSPNPASTQAVVLINNTTEGNTARIKVIDAAGNQVSSQKIKLIQGANPVQLPVGSWPAGNYVVVVALDEGVINKKIIVRR